MANSVDAGNITSQGSVKLSGNDQIEIKGNVYNIGTTHFTKDTTLLQMQDALRNNRISVNEDIDDIENLCSRGYDVSHSEVIVKIKDAITSSRIIESLIAAIKNNGGNAKTAVSDADIIKRINLAIYNGNQQYINRIKREKEEQNNHIAKIIGIIVAVLFVLYWLYIFVSEYPYISLTIVIAIIAVVKFYFVNKNK